MEFQRVVYVLHNHLIGPHKSFENFVEVKFSKRLIAVYYLFQIPIFFSSLWVAKNASEYVIPAYYVRNCL